MITEPPDPPKRPNNWNGHFPLTPLRQELLSWLHEHAPLLEDLYRAALTIFYMTPPLPGRFHLMLHALREIANRIPEALSGIRVKGYMDYKGRLDAIEKLWTREGLNLDGRLPGRETQIPIPRSLYRKLAKLVADHRATRQKPEDAAIRMYMAISPENEDSMASLKPVVARWLKTASYFSGRAHLPGLRETNVREDEFERHFELFEDALGALVRGFYPTLRELNDILEDANTPAS